MQPQFKVCSRCGQPALLDAVECLKCHHAFRLDLNQARRIALGLPEPLPQNTFPITPPSRKHLKIMAAFAIFFVIATGLISVQVIQIVQNRRQSEMEKAFTSSSEPIPFQTVSAQPDSSIKQTPINFLQNTNRPMEEMASQVKIGMSPQDLVRLWGNPLAARYILPDQTVSIAYRGCDGLLQVDFQQNRAYRGYLVSLPPQNIEATNTQK